MLQKSSLECNHPDDSISVLDQLLDQVAMRVTRSNQAHPFGSMNVTEELVEAELAESWVVIPVETDTIPVDIEGVGCWSGMEFRLRFFHPQVRDGKVTYDVELVPVR